MNKDYPHIPGLFLKQNFYCTSMLDMLTIVLRDLQMLFFYSA